MKLLGIPCLESCGWIVALFGLVWTASGFASGQDKMLLGGQDPLFERDYYYDNGYALRATFPIKELPKRIIFKSGEISLVADPTDSRGDYMVVYLVNDTDKPVAKIVGELYDVKSQVRFGAYWFGRDAWKLRCGTVPEPQDLGPRQALALGALRSDLGDTGGEIRYVFPMADKVIFTEPIRGRYEAKRLFTINNLTEHEGDLGTAIHDGLGRNDWSKSRVAHTPGELCAMLELVRHHDLALSERAALFDWIVMRVAKRDATPEQLQIIDELGNTLKKPWMIAGDMQPVVDRSIKALEQDGAGADGTPEKSRIVVWRYLASLGQGESVDRDSQKRMIAMAVKELEASEKDLGDAAADFLAGFFCDPDLVPKDIYTTMLQHESIARNFSGLSGLRNRERSAEAGPWVLDKVKAGDPRCLDFYSIVRSRDDGEMENWEKDVIRILMERKPLEAVGMFSVYRSLKPVREIPVECRNLLRDFFRGELTEARCSWWRDFSKKDWGDRNRSEQTYLQGIHYAVQILDSWDDPQDNELLLALLKHPAASKSSYGFEYEVRAPAKDALVRRKLPVPDNVITREEIKPTKSD